MIPPDSGPTPLNPRGRGLEHQPEKEGDEQRPTGRHDRSESSISDEAQAVRTLASAHRLAGEIENEARRRASEIAAEAELRATEREREARARAEAILAEAKADRDRIWEQIRAGVGRATRQVGDLLRIREELRLDLHEAVRESRSAIARLEEGEAGAQSSAASAPPTSAELPAAPIAGRASEVQPGGSPLSPSSPGAPAPPPAAAPGKPGPEPSAPAGEAAAGGEALSSLRAGPFESFLEVMRFERDLAGSPSIDAVYVRRFSNGEVDVEIDSPKSGGELTEAIAGLPGVAAVQPVGGTLRVRMRSDAVTQE